ncbi:uncharacterized protein LOC110027550 [Phalaenopsis equestris]|uniref:uncharacterized protein LOC110027550 n=1 Tax=Phalaenopsis equestris TaxID=78828 RepID=UPI0009E32400|nr:uncharacterized protein LOC110027550 [Phalaenopsis equestris]
MKETHFNPPFSLSLLTIPFSASPSPEPFSDHPPQLYGSPSSAVPFSWEHQPGIPKLHPPSHSSKPHLLPLPPLRSTVNFPRNKRSSSGDSGDFDPFAVALARCAEDSSGEDIDGMRWRRSGTKWVGVWRRAAVAGGFGLVSFSGSCKTACSVSDAIVALPRAARSGGGSYGRVNRRRE